MTGHGEMLRKAAWDAIQGALLPSAPGCAACAARDFRDAFRAVDEGLRRNGPTLDLRTPGGLLNTGNLEEMARAGVERNATIRAALGDVLGDTDALMTGFQLRKAAQSLGMTEDAARQYAKSVMPVPGSSG